MMGVLAPFYFHMYLNVWVAYRGIPIKVGLLLWANHCTFRFFLKGICDLKTKNLHNDAPAMLSQPIYYVIFEGIHQEPF